MDRVKIEDLRTASDARRKVLLDFIVGEARKGTKSIGFIPRAGLEEAVEQSRVHVMTRNDDPVAFVVLGGKRNRTHIYQAWVRADARLIMHGRALVEYVEKRALRRQQIAISLWCLEDLPSRLFWMALGFKEKERRRKSRLHSREQIRFERETSLAARLLF